MYLFSRSTIAALGRQFDAIPAALEVAEMVGKITGRDVNVFTVRFGAPMGTIMWTTRAESLAEMQELTDKLMADAGYLEKVESMNGLFMAPAEDRFARIITGPGEATSKYYGITRASMITGKFADAMALGVEAAEHIGQSTKRPSAFLKAAYGGFADVTWVTGFDSMDEVDAFDEWQMSDSGYHSIVERAGDLFVESSGHTSLIEKLN
jgi:hypothetical protein